MDITWVERVSWNAAHASGPENVWGNVKVGVAVHWSGADVGDQDHRFCAAQVRGIQRYHQQSRGWADIAYNYLICQHGKVFVGRGLQAASAANGTENANRTFVAVCLLLGPHDRFSGAAEIALVTLRHWLMQRKVRDKVWPHSRFLTTECPGPFLRKWCLFYP